MYTFHIPHTHACKNPSSVIQAIIIMQQQHTHVAITHVVIT